jgi:cell division protein FtsX
MSEEDGRARDKAALQVWRVLAVLLALGGLYGVIFELNREKVTNMFGTFGGPDTTSIFVCILIIIAGCAGAWKAHKGLSEFDD